MKTYTKAGDGGKTGLYGGQSVSKDDLRVEAYGAIDELNASLGWAATQIDDPEISAVVARLQSECFVAGGDLATPIAREQVGGTGVPRISPGFTARLEHEIDLFETELAPLANFILPGGARSAAALHGSRCVCRRAERRIVALQDRDELNPELLPYINRLSDHLFVLARVCNYRTGIQDIAWSR